MFKKIGNAGIGEVNALNKQIEFSTRPNDKNFYGIRYYDTESPLLKSLYSLLPKETHKDFYSSTFIINDNLFPHTDVSDTSALNCYIKPGNYYTNFYSCKPNAKLIKFSDKGDGYAYQKEDLIFAGGFMPKPFDIFLINNQMVHEVVSNTLAREVRQVLQLATSKYSYKEVCIMLKENS